MDGFDKGEIDRLIEGVRHGDEDSFSELVRLYTPMIKSTLSRMRVDADEVFSDVHMAFYKAAMTYDSAMYEVTFGLYARICIQRRVVDLLRRKSSESKYVESDVDVDSIAVDDNTLLKLVREEERKVFLKKCRELLSDMEYDVLLYWRRGERTSSISSALGVSAKSIDNAKHRIIKKLRAGLDSKPD